MATATAEKTNKAVQPTPAKRLAALARRCAEETPVVEDACKAMRARLKTTAADVEYLVGVAIETLIHAARGERRAVLKRVPDVLPEPSKVQATALAGLGELSKVAERSSIFLWTVGDKYLGDLTREELLGEAASTRARMAGLAANATFYEALAGRLKGGERVRDALREAQVAELWKRASGQ